MKWKMAFHEPSPENRLLTPDRVCLCVPRGSARSSLRGEGDGINRRGAGDAEAKQKFENKPRRQDPQGLKGRPYRSAGFVWGRFPGASPQAVISLAFSPT